jgi:nitroimidazol reductase NimA-like FMN-containing flavoprotein (pyridoxamine 5'-phosphate oxidase superfamily)
MTKAPKAEAMSREGKGTQAASEAGRSQPLSWSEVERRLARGGWFWLATVGPDGGPHVMPLFAAWSGTSFLVASKNRARKSRNLEAESRCVISTDTGDLHVIVEGVARHVRDEEGLQRAVEVFQAVYSWPTRVRAASWTPTTVRPPREVRHSRCTKSPPLKRSDCPLTANPPHRHAGRGHNRRLET